MILHCSLIFKRLNYPQDLKGWAYILFRPFQCVCNLQLWYSCHVVAWSGTMLLLPLSKNIRSFVFLLYLYYSKIWWPGIITIVSFSFLIFCRWMLLVDEACQEFHKFDFRILFVWLWSLCTFLGSECLRSAICKAEKNKTTTTHTKKEYSPS